jgi:hypothetical protein
MKIQTVSEKYLEWKQSAAGDNVKTTLPLSSTLSKEISHDIHSDR